MSSIKISQILLPVAHAWATGNKIYEILWQMIIKSVQDKPGTDVSPD